MSSFGNVRMGLDDDSPYAVFDQGNSAIDTNLENDEEFNRALTSHGRAKFGKTSSSTNRPPTTAFRPQNEVNRPITAVTGANYKKPTSAMKFKSIDSIAELNDEQQEEEKIKEAERKVSKLVDESIIAFSKGETGEALEKAKLAGRNERAVSKQRENSGLGETQNMDLTYSVLFNLAVQYELNELYTEALNYYQVIVKNKMFSQVGRIRVNMGNIHFRLREYQKAVKQYRMALDQVPNHFRTMRIRIMGNIGACFIKMGLFNDAVTSYEHIMNEHPNFKPGFNLVLCYYARSMLISDFKSTII